MTIAQTPQTSPSPGTVLDLPAGAKTLEGIPRVQVETTENTTTRRVLEPADAARKHLTIRLDDGRYFWGRDSRPLNVVTSGGYIYLSSAEPGKYIRLRRINDRLTYVEHVDMGLRSETYWGELRIVLGR
jgi:hypothetical protein